MGGKYTKERRAEYMRGYRKTAEAYQRQIKSPSWKWGVWKDNLKQRYGVTPAWVGIKFLEQYGNCAICEHPLYYNVWGEREDKTYSIHIDHDHKTGKPRGLLCQNCNIAIGKLQDDTNIIWRAAWYKQRYSGV